MIIKTKLVKNLTPKEYSKVTSLTLRNKGFSRGHIRKSYKNKDKYTKIILAFDNDKLISWVLLLQFDFDDKKCKEYSINFYTRKSYRKQGIGSKLFKYLKILLDKENSIGHVCVWSKESDFFYSKNTSNKIKIIISTNYQKSGWRSATDE